MSKILRVAGFTRDLAFQVARTQDASGRDVVEGAFVNRTGAGFDVMDLPFELRTTYCMPLPADWRSSVEDIEDNAAEQLVHIASQAFEEYALRIYRETDHYIFPPR